MPSLKEQCPHLEVISADEIDFRKVSVILGQDVFSAIRPMEYRLSDRHSGRFVSQLDGF